MSNGISGRRDTSMSQISFRSYTQKAHAAMTGKHVCKNRQARSDSSARTLSTVGAALKFSQSKVGEEPEVCSYPDPGLHGY